LIIDEPDPDSYFDLARPVLRSAEIVVGHVEVPFTLQRQGTPNIPLQARDQSTYTGAEAETLERMKDDIAPRHPFRLGRRRGGGARRLTADHRILTLVSRSSDRPGSPNGVSDVRVPRVDLIRQAALRHFAEHGYDAASMRQIAADAGITIATLYFHCSTKEQLFFEVLETQMRALSEGLDAALADAPDDWGFRLSTAIRFHLQYVTRDEAGANISTSELRGLTGELRERHLATRDAYERKFRDLLRGGIAAGAFAPVDVPVITAGILGIGLAVGRWYRPGGRLSSDEIAEEYVRFVLKALHPRPPGPLVPDRPRPKRRARTPA
jgi:AcrR family transcriptional regulator